MRRADRLFEIVQLIRARKLTTAAELGRELEVSERTIYRDIHDLQSSGVPIEGEAGVGYVLPASYTLPPLMFTEQEIEALVLGARMVAAWGDRPLAREARRVLDKVENVLPPHLETRVGDVRLFAPGFHVTADAKVHLDVLRRGLAERKKLGFDYTRADGVDSTRTVRPLGLFFWGQSWSFLAWCELRDDFRTFRPDRMRNPQLLAATFVDEPGRDLESFMERMRRWQDEPSDGDGK